MNENKKSHLIKYNIKQFFSEIKFRRKEKKKFKLDRLIQKLPVGDFGYEDLTPESEIKNGEQYLKALQWGLKNKNVKNIALAGPYGSGKSSIIQSYLNKYPSTKALNISLATFDFQKENENDFENTIELGILKQLFYKVDSNKIPQSRYRKIRKKYYRQYLLATTIITIFSLLAFAFFLPEEMKKVLNKIVECGNYYSINENVSYLITSLFGIVGIVVISYLLKWCFSQFRIKEVNLVDKATIDNEKDESSIFDKSMDEIVYFFEATDYNIVFIEDLDRFDSTKIFVKLRELNTILNNYDLIKRRIVFVYAIKDDMFKNKERTKFFDFIIPVIPIINSTNSGEILREKLKIKKQENGIIRSSLYNISSAYITLISPFIEDMRVLTNICNEFIVYKNTLNSVQLKDEEMFSIMIFKNLYPSDFADLEFERGIIKEAFIEKRRFITTKQSELNGKKREAEEILNGIERDVLNSVKDVKAAFLQFLVGDNSPFHYCTINSQRYYYENIMQDEFDMNIFETYSEFYIYDYRQSSYYINDLNAKMQSQNVNYFERICCLKNNEELRKEELCKQIENYEKTISELYTYSLKVLIEKFGSENIFSDDVKQNKFLVFLLRKGFINENYADYINYFHPNSITKDEMNFIRGIRMQESVNDFSYRIKNVAEVCERIEDYEFRQRETLNFDIIDYLVTKKRKDNKCTELFIGLAKGDKIYDKFIRAYIERKQNLEAFINILCKYYKMFWAKISEDNLLTEEHKYYYLYLIIQYADLDDIVEMDRIQWVDEEENEITGISDFIVDNKESLIKLSKVSSERMIDVIDKLKIVFTDIEIDGVDRKVVEHIFDNENNYYNYWLNVNMIQSLFKFFYPDRVEELKTSNYSVILETKYIPLLNNIYNNFEEYVSKLVLGQETNVNENINAVENILERLFDCNVNLCLNVLDKENIIWDNIEDCCICTDDKKQERKVIWDYVLESRKVKESWNNYMKYYQEYKLTFNLVQWVNAAIDTLVQEERMDQITDDIIKEIIIEDISLDAFKKLMRRYKVNNFDYPLSYFDSDKIAVLIDYNYIPFTIEYLNEIQQEAAGEVVNYIISNKEKFMQNITNIRLNIDIISDLIKSDQFTENEMKILLKLFAPRDMTEKMAYQIRNLEMKLDKNYVEKAWELLKEDDRYQLFLNQLDIYSNDEIALKLSILDPVYKPLADRSRRHKEYLPIDNIGYNEKFLDKLKKKKYFTSVEKEEYDEEDTSTHTKKHMQRFVVWVKQKQ